jgi:hypothetical protein
MTRYFYDCEFLEGTQTKRFLGMPYGKTKPTIDLISIGIVAEDGRELYLISKEFNLREAWDRHDIKTEYRSGDARNHLGDTYLVKDYWIRENVIKPIWDELISNHIGCKTNISDINYEGGLKAAPEWHFSFSYRSMKYLINKYGYTNVEIAEKVKEFVYNQTDEDKYYNEISVMPIELYGYYSSYDHVVLCQLFGKMIDLPKGFPMYTIDLQQMLDSYIDSRKKLWGEKAIDFDMLNHIKTLPNYPKQINEHNALADARWNKELYNFIKSL